MSRQTKVYHVAPHQEGYWKVQRRGATRATIVTDRKEEALATAKRLAQDPPGGQVILHGPTGQVEGEYTCGEDPPPAGSG